jgi:organic radical activating enzyme
MAESLGKEIKEIKKRTKKLSKELQKEKTEDKKDESSIKQELNKFDTKLTHVKNKVVTQKSSLTQRLGKIEDKLSEIMMDAKALRHTINDIQNGLNDSGIGNLCCKLDNTEKAIIDTLEHDTSKPRKSKKHRKHK